jgi:hypothetical protein
MVAQASCRDLAVLLAEHYIGIPGTAFADAPATGVTGAPAHLVLIGLCGGWKPFVRRQALTGTASSTVSPSATDPEIVPSWCAPPSSANTMSLARLTRLKVWTLAS